MPSGSGKTLLSLSLNLQGRPKIILPWFAGQDVYAPFISVSSSLIELLKADRSKLADSQCGAEALSTSDNKLSSVGFLFEFLQYMLNGWKSRAGTVYDWVACQQGVLVSGVPKGCSVPKLEKHVQEWCTGIDGPGSPVVFIV